MQMIIKNVELWAGGISAVALLVGTLIVHAPVWLSLVVAVCLFIGFYLLGSYWTDIQIQYEATLMTVESMQTKISKGLMNVIEIRNQASNIEEVKIKDQIIRICEVAYRIFKNFEKDSSDVAKASRFLLYLDRFLPLIERYVRLSSTPEGRQVLKKSSEDEGFVELLDVVEQGFSNGFQNYLENDVVELRTLSRVMKKMMNVAEIGK